MPQTKEGDIAKCTICDEDITDDVFWTIERYEKNIPLYPCPNCGKPIRIEFFPTLERFRITKPCSCTVDVSSEALEPHVPRWKRRRYVYCDECFKKAHGNILYELLGEDESE